MEPASNVRTYTSRGQNGDVATVARPWISQGKHPLSGESGYRRNVSFWAA